MKKKSKDFDQLSKKKISQLEQLAFDELFENVNSLLESPFNEDHFQEYCDELKIISHKLAKEYYYKKVHPDYIPFQLEIIKDNLKNVIREKADKIIKVASLHESPIDQIRDAVIKIKTNIIENISFGLDWHNNNMNKTKVNQWFEAYDFVDFIIQIEIIEQLEFYIANKEPDIESAVKKKNKQLIKSVKSIVDNTIGKDIKPEDSEKLFKYLKPLITDCVLMDDILPIRIDNLKKEDIFSFMHKIWKLRTHSKKRYWRKQCCVITYKIFSINFGWGILDESNWDSHSIEKQFAYRGKYTNIKC